MLGRLDIGAWAKRRKAPLAEQKQSGRPNFLLGVGCQKGGTTWLYDYLKSHPAVLMSPLKEMHVFDAVYRPDLFSGFYRQRLSNLHRLLAAAIKAGQLTPHKNKAIAQRMNFLQIYHDLTKYNDYFSDLIAKKRSGKRPELIGEITPSYSALSAKHFAEIRDLLKKDFNVKVVFLMRDPIERILSAYRMVERKRRERGQQVNLPAQEQFKETYSGKQEVARTSYEKTIVALESAFEPSQIFYGFYETLFNEAEMKRLCRFLEINYIPANFDKRVNASPGGGKLDAETIKAARIFYDRTYKFCAERFSPDFIKSIWRHY